MSVAPNLEALKARVDRFLWQNSSNDAVSLNYILKRFFLRFHDVVIFGGMVRDIARGGRYAFKSDVDIVLDASVAQIELLAKVLGARRNKFGGYRVVILDWSIDFWPLSLSWARRYVEIESFEDLVDSTFFNWDAVAYHIGSRKIICREDYLDPIHNGVLDISLVANPSVGANLLKAVLRLIYWDAIPGVRLRMVLDQVIDQEMVDIVNTKVSSGVAFESACHLKEYIFSRRSGGSGFDLFGG